MNRQQGVLLAGGMILMASLFFFADTTVPASDGGKTGISASGEEIAPLTTEILLDSAKRHISDFQNSVLTRLEHSVVRGNVKEQQIDVYRQMADYWKDSLGHPEIGAYYAGEAAKLEKSEKSLTFAARLFLGRLMITENVAMQNWLAGNAKTLYELALNIDPANDSLKVELGSCYIFSNISATPMEGILKIKEVTERDSNNMYAQLMLGLGDIKSGQYDKAIERLQKVATNEPSNLQAVFNLAETFERKGDKENAVRWYNVAANMVTIPEAKHELEQRINSLK